MAQAAVDVVFQEQKSNLIRRGRQRFDLLEHVKTVRLFLDEPLDTTSLSLDAPQSRDEVAAVLRVGVPEVGGPRVARHTGAEYACRAEEGQYSTGGGPGSMPL